MKKIINKKLKTTSEVIKYLEDKGVPHNILEHKTVYTAFDAASTMRKKLDEIVKSLLVQADKKYFVVCLPANHNLNLSKIKKIIKDGTGENIKVVQIPSEKVVQKMLKAKDVSLSAFGSFHDLPVVLEKKLKSLKKAIFSSGKFDHSVEMAVKDFIKLENVMLGTFGIKKKVKIINPKIKSKSSFKKTRTKVMKKKTAKKAAPKKKVVKKVAKKKPAKKVVKKTVKKAVKKVVKKVAKKKPAKKVVKKVAKKKPAKKKK